MSRTIHPLPQYAFMPWCLVKVQGQLYLYLYPPYSPDIAPQRFPYVDPMKVALRGRRFSSDEEVIDAVQNWLKTRPKNFFLMELKNLWNSGTGALKSRGITLRSDISFISVTINVFFKSPFTF
jgi:hypothetical protein